MTSPHQPPGLKAVVVGPGYPLGLRLKFNADTGTGEGVTLPVSGVMREAFPRERHGGAKAAIYAAYRYISPKVQKQFTERRARSIWEGTAKRIDAEEAAVLRRARLEEARREQAELRERLARLDTALAAIDEDFHGPQMAAHRAAASGLGRVGRSGA